MHSCGEDPGWWSQLGCWFYRSLVALGGRLSPLLVVSGTEILSSGVPGHRAKVPKDALSESDTDRSGAGITVRGLKLTDQRSGVKVLLRLAPDIVTSI